MKFAELQAADYKSITVALFYSPECSVCAVLRPKLTEVCKRLGVRLEEFNAYAEKNAAAEHGVRVVPTVLTVHKGVVKRIFIGIPQNISERLVAAGVIEK
jgi:thiol-disulfide isomerase/thioredoxin